MGGIARGWEALVLGTLLRAGRHLWGKLLRAGRCLIGVGVLLGNVMPEVMVAGLSGG